MQDQDTDHTPAAPGEGDPAGEFLEPLAGGQTFRFACHRDVPCFTDCCRDLHLVLTPYDVLRAKRGLGLDARSFLEMHTDADMDPDWGIPVVRLRMLDNEARTCPFVTPEGCSIYEDRPGACRAYPLGRAVRRTSGSRASGFPAQEEHFLVRESHCKGFQEGREWTAAAWMQDQGLELHNRMNDRWMAFLSRHRAGIQRGLSQKQWEMFYMACYSLDRFRDFVFGTRFLSLFEIPPERKEQLGRSDEALLRFAFEWLSFSLFGEPVLTFR